MPYIISLVLNFISLRLAVSIGFGATLSAAFLTFGDEAIGALENIISDFSPELYALLCIVGIDQFITAYTFVFAIGAWYIALKPFMSK